MCGLHLAHGIKWRENTSNVGGEKISFFFCYIYFIFETKKLNTCVMLQVSFTIKNLSSGTDCRALDNRKYMFLMIIEG